MALSKSLHLYFFSSKNEIMVSLGLSDKLSGDSIYSVVISVTIIVKSGQMQGKVGWGGG